MSTRPEMGAPASFSNIAFDTGRIWQLHVVVKILEDWCDTNHTGPGICDCYFVIEKVKESKNERNA